MAIPMLAKWHCKNANLAKEKERNIPMKIPIPGLFGALLSRCTPNDQPASHKHDAGSASGAATSPSHAVQTLLESYF